MGTKRNETKNEKKRDLFVSSLPLSHSDSALCSHKDRTETKKTLISSPFYLHAGGKEIWLTCMLLHS